MATPKFRFYLNAILRELPFANIMMRNDDFDLVTVEGDTYVPRQPYSASDLTLPYSLWFKVVGDTLEMYYGSLLVCVIDSVNGNLIYGIGNESVVPIEKGGTGAATVSGARTALGLGDAALRTVGTAVNNLVQVLADGKLPALDGSNLTGLDALLPVGSVVYFPFDTPPTGFLAGDGSLLVRATFPELFAKIGETFGAGDGVTTFRIMDLRGIFIRGLDGGRGIDVGRTLGSMQNSRVGSAGMEDFTEVRTPFAYGYLSMNVFAPKQGVNPNYGGTTNSYRADLTATNIGETRPINMALLPCVKY